MIEFGFSLFVLNSVFVYIVKVLFGINKLGLNLVIVICFCWV